MIVRMSDFLKKAAIIAFAGAAALQMQARIITVTGRVTAQKTGEPMPAVTIYDADTDRLIGSTNEEGYYQFDVDDASVLLFSILGSEDMMVNVDGRQRIDLVMNPTAVVLGEVVVQGKRVTNMVLAEPTDIDVKGNYLHVKTRMKVPRELFSSSDRLIVQPTIYNVTRKKTTYLRPLVFDGFRYAITQERMLDWNRDADPLTPYVQVKKTGRRVDDVITVSDSAYVDNPADDFRCDLFMSLENYNRVFYVDTTTIARGTVNPLRFLNYELGGQYVDELTFLPKPEMQLRDTKGDVNLTFKVGKTDLDMSLGNNRKEMDDLLALLHSIESSRNMGLKSFRIHGTASPEGRVEHNRNLATKRVNSAMDVIVGQLSDITRRRAEINSSASVASWSDVVTLMRADSLMEQADEVDAIIKRYPQSPERQQSAIRRLPFYRTIDTEYLPRLRKVEYEIVTSQYRYLTDPEIAELYRENPSSMSRYEFWRLYSLADSLPEKESIIRKALEVHPSFNVGLTDLSAVQILNGEPDPSILQPIMNSRRPIPNASRLNQAISLMATNSFASADSLAQLLPDEKPYHKAKIYARATSGHYEEVIQEVSEDSPFNEVLLLLAIKANDKAWQKAQKLGNSAREEYIKAVAANRVDEYMAAVTHLEKAFELDPSLREIARVDGDVIDLLEADE